MRLAETPAGKQIAEGRSAADRLSSSAGVSPSPASRVGSAGERNADYVPRRKKPDWLSGGKIAGMVDRIEWITMPDARPRSTRCKSGEIDFLEQPSVDLPSVLEANSDLTVAVLNKFGFRSMAG